MTQAPIHIIGGGMAGSEAAWQCVQQGVPVVLHEMRPKVKTFAHTGEDLAELVCSNSFRSDDATASAVGLLHEEMRRCNSLILAKGDAHRLPAGGALAVDRDAFAQSVTQTLTQHPLVTLAREEVTDLTQLDSDNVIVATGPLTSEALGQSILAVTQQDSLAFFDAIAPIVHTDSIDFSKAWFQSRYDKGTGKDYINLPLDRDQYEAFIDDLLAYPKTYFEGCLPIEVMAERGRETLRFGPLKPVGLTNPHNPEVKPYAVVQLRQDNALGTLFNMVGFQTKLKYGAQAEVFRKIPGLEGAEFARLGGIHRNTFINSPRLLDPELRLKAVPRIRFAGQVTGVEGYVESAACGLMAGRFAAAQRLGLSWRRPPATTAMGALLDHVTINADQDSFQPMNINFGLMPDITNDPDFPPPKGKRKLKGADRKAAYCQRALRDLDAWRAD